MAVTILEEPADVALAYNPVRFKVQAEKLFEAGGGLGNTSVFDFGPRGAHIPLLTAGDSFDLVVFGSVINFVFTDSTTPTPGKLPTQTAAAGGDYSIALKAFLEANHLIFKNYLISLNGADTVYIQGRVKGSDYDVSVLNESFANTVDWSCDVQTSGEIALYVTNRFVRGDLYVEDIYNNGQFNYFAHIENQIIDDDELWFDFSSKMEAYVNRLNEKDWIGTDGMARLVNINKRYYVVFTEYDAGGYASVNEFAKSNTLRFIKAGIKEDEYRIIPDVLTTYLKDKEKVMSWRPTRRDISPNQLDHLYFINWKGAATTIRGKVKLYYTNNTTETITADTSGVLHTYESYLWNVGHDRIIAKATIPAGHSVRGYECWWADQADNRLCESVFYTVRAKTYFDRYFFYESSWGTFETFKTESLHSYAIDAEKEEVLAAVSASDDYNKGDIRDIVHEFVEIFKGSTGNVSESEALALADFIISENKYLLRGNRLVNITVPENSVSPYKDDGYPHGFKFTYKRATTQRKYSNLIGVKAVDGLLGEDAGEGGVVFEPG